MKVSVDFSSLSDDEHKNSIEMIRNRYYHCKRRASERYCVSLNQNDYFNLVDQILAGEALFIQECDFLGGKFLYEVEFKQRKLLAVYDYDSGTICTFLSEEMIKKNDVWWRKS